MYCNGFRTGLLRSRSYLIVLLLIGVFLIAISNASRSNPSNHERYSYGKEILSSRSAKGQRHYATSPVSEATPRHSHQKQQPFRNNKLVFNVPKRPVDASGNKRGTAETSRAGVSKRRKRKQNPLTSSLKDHNFWERDFGAGSNRKTIRSGPPLAEYSRPSVAESSNRYLDKSPFIQEDHPHRPPASESSAKSKKANIVLIMTDDLDVELGSLNYMPKLLRLLGEQGAMFSNSYTSTPMCCPSRSSMLTGMYIHNHEVYTNNQNCSSSLWQRTHERRSFATYLRNSGYKTGYFGKYLNRYNGSHVPAGWSEWVGLIGNSRYYNYSVNRNQRNEKYGNRYPHDYFPHVITSDGLDFIKKHSSGEDPFLLVMSYPAPHGPEDSAPAHSHRFFNASDHHTASYNYAPNPDKQWILQWTDRMDAMEMKFTDLLMTKRLQTLQSVDESIAKVIYELQKRKQLENTYVFFTSDHGYHLGQFGLAKGKSMPFEFDIKVPFFVRGPGIKAGTILPQIALNIDLAPTFLDIASVAAPAHMDGRSLLHAFEISPANNTDVKPWRDTFLVESSGRVREEEELLKKEQRTYEREKALSMSVQSGSADGGGSKVPLYTSKHERFQEVCMREKFKAPCHDTQKWYCARHGDRWRLKKCRNKSSVWRKRCICQSKFGFGTFNKLDPHERRKQKKFIKRYVAKNRYGFNGKFIQSFNQLKLPLPGKKRHHKRHHRHARRFIRSAQTPISTSAILADDATETGFHSNVSATFDTALFDGLNEEETVHAFVAEEELRDLENQIIDISDELRILENITFNLNKDNSEKVLNKAAIHGSECNYNESLCHVASTETLNMWKNSKLALRDHIIRLNSQLSVIKDIYTHLQETQPTPELFPLETVDVGHGWQLNDSIYRKEKFPPSGSNFALSNDDDWRQYIDNKQDYYYGLNDNRSSVPPRQSQLNTDHQKMGLKKWSSLGKPTKQHKNLRGDAFDAGARLKPIPLSYLLSDFTKFGNEALLPVCWCDQRVFLKLEMQKRRSQRRIERKKLKEERNRRRLSRRQKKKRKLQWCAHPNLHCFAHDNTHWRTPPLWNDGSFCFCISAANNTYWCLRTITAQRNFLYCEFITGLVTYYDLHIDPYQLRNVAFTLSNAQVMLLHAKLTRLRTCSGASGCHEAAVADDNFDGRKSRQGAHSPRETAAAAVAEPPRNEVYANRDRSSAAAKKSRNRKIKKLRRKLRRRLLKEEGKKRRKSKYAALSRSPPESWLMSDSANSSNRRTKLKRHRSESPADRRRKRHKKKQRRKRKSKRKD